MGRSACHRASCVMGHVQSAGSGGGSGSLQDKRHFLQVRLLLLRRWCKTVYFIRYLFKSFNYISCFHSLYSKGTIVWLNERLPPANFIVQTAWSSLGLKHISRSGLNVCGKWRETLETKEALIQILFLRCLFTHWHFLNQLMILWRLYTAQCSSNDFTVVEKSITFCFGHIKVNIKNHKILWLHIWESLDFPQEDWDCQKAYLHSNECCSCKNY